MNHFRVRKFDKLNWVIEEWAEGKLNPFTKEPGKGKWTIIGYYGQLCDVANALLRLQIKVPDGTLEMQLPALVAEIKAAEIRITEELRTVAGEVS